jgi:hypothetical protein
MCASVDRSEELIPADRIVGVNRVAEVDEA